MLKTRQVVEAIANDFNCEGDILAERINKLKNNGINETEICGLHYIRKNANREIHLEKVSLEEYLKCKDILIATIEHIYIEDKQDVCPDSSTIKTVNWQPKYDKTRNEVFISNKIKNLQAHNNYRYWNLDKDIDIKLERHPHIDPKRYNKNENKVLNIIKKIFRNVL